MNLEDGPLALDGNVSAQFDQSLVPIMLSIKLLRKLSETLDDFRGLVDSFLFFVVSGASVEIVATSVIATAASTSSTISTTLGHIIHHKHYK
jgi:hypothetical protein